MYPFSLSRSSTEAVTTVTGVAGELALHDLHALGGGEQHHGRHVVRAALDQLLDRRDERAAGGQHRVEDVDLAPGQVVRHACRVRGRLERLLVAHHAEEAHLGGRQQPHHAVEHAETGPQDRHDQGPRVGELHAGRARDRGLDVDLLGAHVPGGLVREQGDQLVGEAPEGRGVGALVAQRGEFVRHQRVVDNMQTHNTSKGLNSEDGRSQRPLTPGYRR